MASLQQLVDYSDKRTQRTAFKDFPGSHNGLQVANDGLVTKIGAAVDAGLVPFEKAVERGIDYAVGVGSPEVEATEEDLNYVPPED